MALITSAASGNFSAGATWTGGVVPGVGDEARASTGHTITIDVNTTCDEISNAGTGEFVINDGITLTANVTNKAGAAGNCLEFLSNVPASATIVGVCTGNTLNGTAVNNLGTGTLSITGNCIGGNGTFGSSLVNAVRNSSTGIVNITGDCTGGSLNGSASVFNNSTGQINITGNCFAGTSSSANGAVNNSTGILTVIGTIASSQAAPGVAGTNVQQTTILSGPFLTEAVRGVVPVYCAAWRWNASPSNSTYMEVMTNTFGAKRNLYTADNITGMPDESDVKDGVTYGPANELTGSMGYTLSPSVNEIRDAVWGSLTSSLTTAGSIGERLKNSATVATTGEQIATALTAP